MSQAENTFEMRTCKLPSKLQNAPGFHKCLYCDQGASLTLHYNEGISNNYHVSTTHGRRIGRRRFLWGFLAQFY